MGVFFYLNFANVSEKITQYQTHKHYIADFLTGGGGGGGGGGGPHRLSYHTLDKGLQWI